MLKRGSLVLLLFIISTAIMAAPAVASDNVYSYFKVVKLIIGQKEAEVNYKPAVMEQACYVKDSRTLVPLRFVGESLGAQVSWDNNAKQASLTLAGTTVRVTIGSKVAYVNGKMTTLDVPAEIKGGRTFIPMRFVSESLGAYVDYIAESKTVLVRYADMSSWKDYTAPNSGLKYKYPADWSVETMSNDEIVVFTAPNGSKLLVYLTSSTFEDARSSIMKSAVDRNFSLLVDERYDPKDINAGFRLGFGAYDPQASDNIRYLIYAEPISAGNFVVEQLIHDKNVEIDHVVMMTIAYS